ncbi:MAG: hypothetical protein NVSMB6_02020 [Burkholderiaceae bacterium]
MLALVGVVWALPLSLLGLIIAVPVLLAGGQVTIELASRTSSAGSRRGLLPALLVRGRVGDFLLAHHPFGAMQGMAVGHVVIVHRDATLRRLLAHEMAHVAQAACWGVLFPFAYLSASAWAFSRGRDGYWDNVFEVAARKAEQHASVKSPPRP